MKGIYILIINIKGPITIKIGKLGNINFPRSLYAYIGSSQNNLEKRIKRHLSSYKKIHWHIDYLLKNKNSEITKIYFNNKSKKYECIYAKALIKNNQLIPNFGSSDCKCKSHLIKFKKNISNIKDFKEFNL